MAELHWLYHQVYINIGILIIDIRLGRPLKTSFATLDDQLPSMSGVHGLKDFLSSDHHLVELFDGRSYTYGSVLKGNLYHKTTQQDGHY